MDRDGMKKSGDRHTDFNRTDTYIYLHRKAGAVQTLIELHQLQQQPGISESKLCTAHSGGRG